MNFIRSMVSLCSLSTFAMLILHTSISYAQVEDPIFNNNFKDSLGIWTNTQSAELVGLYDQDNWVKLENDGSGMTPSIMSAPVYLKDFCSARLVFDLISNSVDRNEKVYVQISSDFGKTFQFLRAENEQLFLESETSFVHNRKETYKFPLRGFLTDSMLIKISTTELADGSQLYLDNIKVEAVQKEDYLLAQWDMGEQSSGDMASKIEPRWAQGNCGGVTAHPAAFTNNIEHFGVRGYLYNEIPTSTDPNIKADGGLCLDYGTASNPGSVKFPITVGPRDKGRISGFEFMMQAPQAVENNLNNYPTHFDFKIYKEDKLIFSQSNIKTTRTWSENIFRLSHINELVVSESTDFTFELAPTSRAGNKGGQSVWMIDEVNILGGCCITDCDVISVSIDEQKTVEGVMLEAEIEGDENCNQPCSGTITNATAEAVSLLSQQSTGWSYFNNATTVENKNIAANLPSNFDTHSFRLSAMSADRPQYLETDIINLCPGETYSVCFDHLQNQVGNPSTAEKDGLTLSVNNKRGLISSQVNATQTCVSFVADASNHTLRLSTETINESNTNYSNFYVDNIQVEHIQTGENEETNVIWNGEKSTLTTIHPQIDVNVEHNFFLTDQKEDEITYKKKQLYSLCFETLAQDNISDVEQVKITINNSEEKEVDPKINQDEQCFTFLTDEKSNTISYSILDKNGLPINEEKVVLVNLRIFQENIIAEEDQLIDGLMWVLPDGRRTSTAQVEADQDGNYSLEFTNCFECILADAVTINIEHELCPDNVTVSCDESLDPESNENLQLTQPDQPYSIGNTSYTDILSDSIIYRNWTIQSQFNQTNVDTVTCIQVITIVDEDPPVIETQGDRALSCLSELPTPEVVSVSDNCSSDIQLNSEDRISENYGCPDDPIIVTRIWTAIDESGNTTEAIETYTIIHQAPTASCPRSKTVLCDSDITPSEITMNWPCVTRTFTYATEVSLASGTAGCNGARYDMTYTIKDDCNRTTYCNQSFFLTYQDLNVTCPDNEIVACIEDFTAGTPDYTSSCNHNASYAYASPSLTTGITQCNGSIYEVVYTVTNSCNQIASCVQEVTIDNEGISIICPAAEQVSCPSDIVAGTPTITTACGVDDAYMTSNPTLVSGIAECIGAQYQLTYTAMDVCGQSTQCTQTFTIINPGISITCPADKTVTCSTDINPDTPDITAYCNTGVSYSTSLPNARTSALNCDQEVYELSYTATNNCGENASCIQLITLNNNGLTLSCPANRIVECFDNISSEEPFITSACNVNTDYTYSSPILSDGILDCHQSTYIITYEATDACGNLASCDQVFTLESAPISITCPADLTVFSFDEVAASAPIITESCSVSYTTTTNEAVLESINCDEAIFSIYYEVNNDCSEYASCQQTITLYDDYNAIDAEYICNNPILFVGLDCDEGGIDDIDECNDGTDPEDPCDDVSFIVSVTPASCFGYNDGAVEISSTNGNPPYEYSLDQLSWKPGNSFENLEADNYVLYVQTTNGPACAFEFPFVVSEPQLSAADAGPDQEICIAYSTDLTASGGSYYLWSTGETTATITVQPSSTTTYSVTVTQNDGCFNTDQVQVIVHENTAANAGEDEEICISYSATLAATGGVSYLWSNNEISATITVSPTTTTDYTVTVTDHNGCTDIDVTSVTVNQNNSANAGLDQAICLFSETSLTAQGGETYLWSNGASTETIVVDPIVSTTYTVTVTDANGCTDVDEVFVMVYDLPTADAGADVQICFGDETTLTATGGDSYIWSNGETTSNITVSPTSTTNYFVTVTDSNGCTGTDEVNVTVFDLPMPTISNNQDLCFGSVATISAGGGDTYLWSNGETTSDISVSPLTSTSYQVTVTSVDGCTDTAESTINILDLPIADAGADQNICLNEEPTLIATGGISYLWNTEETAAMIIVDPTAETTYTVTVTDSHGCTQSDEVTVFVNDLPIADAGADTQICFGDETLLSATGGDSYLWSNGETTSNITVSPTATTNYFVTVTDSNGCTGTDEVNVTVFDLPMPTISNNQDLCFGSVATISAGGGDTYLWSNGATTSDISVSPLTSTTYQVTVTSVDGCSDTAESTINILDLPIADAGNDQNICMNTEATLIATGGVSYLWNTDETAAMIVVDPTAETTYTVTVTDSHGCTQSDEVTVFVNDLPTADAGADAQICYGDETILTATGGDNYIWNNGETTSNITVSPTATTDYFVTVTDSNGCTGTDEVNVTVFDLPISTISNNQDLCFGSVANISAGGGDTYLWSNGETTSDISVSPSNSTTYQVTVTSVDGCTDTAESTINILDLPIADAGNDQNICMNTEATLIATGGVSYLWNTDETAAMIVVDPTVETTYTVTVTDSHGCTQSDEVTVFVNDLPTADAGADAQICFGDETALTATGGDSYLWSNGETTSNIIVSPNVTTNYFVTVTDSNGCTGTDEVNVTVFDLPMPTISNNQDLCFGSVATISAGGGDTYLWSNGETTSDISVSPSTSTTYQVTVTSVDGCTDTAESTINILDLPIADTGADQNICIYEETTLIATGGVSYLWNTDETAAMIVVDPTVETTYTVTVTDSHGCTQSDQVTVFVNDLPTADAGADTQICFGDETTLTATGGDSYIWSNGETTSNITISPNATTDYFVTVTDSNGCTGTDEVNVTVFDLPMPTISNNQDLCFGSVATIIAGGGDTYLWSNGATTSEISVSPSTSTTYQVTVTSVDGCTDTAESTTNILDLPIVDAGSDQNICLYEEVTLIATGGVSYLWNTDETSAMIIVDPISETTYTVTVTDNHGCTQSDQVTVFVNDLPTADAGADAQICFGDETTLTATGGDSYLWSNGETTSNIIVSPTSTTDYFVTVTDSNGCTGTDEVNVTVFDLPITTISADLETCPLEEVILVASGGDSYLWSNNETSSEITVIPTATTTYQVTVTDSNSCSNTEFVTVTVLPLPPADAGVDQHICIDNSTELVASGGVSYLWSTGETYPAIIVEPSYTTNYSVTVTDAYGCTNEDAVEVNVHDYPIAELSPWAIACGTEPATITAGGGTNYLWSTGETTASISILPSNFYETYSVTVSNDYGCSDEAQIDVFVLETYPIYTSPDQNICAGGSASLSAFDGEEYVWTPNLYLNTNEGANVTSTPDSTITYTVTSTDESGCTSTAEVTVTIVVDNVPPTALCQNFNAITDSNGESTITPLNIDNGSYDNCGNVSLTLDTSTFACLLLDYTVTMTVTDDSGNTSTCQAIVNLLGPDNDCDLYHDACDVCDGADDSIDNDGDGLPDCSNPPANYTDIEELWKCGVNNNGEQKAWVCHYPNQSICIDYSEVYTYVSYYQNDYLGPCHSQACYNDIGVSNEGNIHSLDGDTNLKISCEAIITGLNDETDLSNALKETVSIESQDCFIAKIELSHNEADLQEAKRKSQTLDVIFTAFDICGNTSNCSSILKLEPERLFLFPNPSRDIFNISGLNGEAYEIYSVQGKKILSGLTDKLIDAKNLDVGFYILMTASGRTSRFVVID